MKKELIVCLLFMLFLASLANAELDIERQHRLEYGKVIYVKNITVEPSKIAPGETALVKIRIKNIDKYFLRDLVVSLDLPESFAPAIGDVAYKKIRTLEAYESLTLYFHILALPDAEPGVYTASLSISYLNSVGDIVNETRKITLAIGTKPEIIAYVSDSEIYKEQKTGEVTISIANKGLSEIKLLTAELKKSKDYEVLSSRTKYIGDLESDDFEEITFLIKLNTGKDVVKLPLLLEYRDNMNNKHKEKVSVELRVYSKRMVQGSNMFVKLLVVIVIIAFIYFMRRRKRKYMKEKE